MVYAHMVFLVEAVQRDQGLPRLEVVVVSVWQESVY